MKRIIFITTLTSLLFLMSTLAYGGTKEEYISYLENFTDEPIQEMFYDDFNKDGSYEMFAIVGNKYPADDYTPEIILGDVYYINDLNVLHNNVSTSSNEEYTTTFVADSIKIVDLGDCKHLYINKWFQTDNITLVYEANNGNPILSVGNMEFVDNNNIICNVSAYDFSSDGSGHTWKDYWFYWDSENKSYCEYGGIYITKDQLLSFNGAENILNSISGEITDIIYRGNGIININVRFGSEIDFYTRGNYTLRYEDNNVWLESENDGYYLPAINLWNENIDYPEFVTEKTEKPITVILNGQTLTFEENPYIENGTTRVPMRAIFEALGATVDYDAATKTITATKDGTVIELVTGATTAKINGNTVTLSASVENKNGYTMVPLRFVSEALGAEVNWNGEDRVITINLENKSKDTINIDIKENIKNAFKQDSDYIYSTYGTPISDSDGDGWWSRTIEYASGFTFDLYTERDTVYLIYGDAKDIFDNFNKNEYTLDEIISSLDTNNTAEFLVDEGRGDYGFDVGQKYIYILKDNRYAIDITYDGDIVKATDFVRVFYQYSEDEI